MGFTAKILGPCRVLVVNFTASDAYDLLLVTGSEAESLSGLPAVKEKAGKAPLLIMACGYGVITKEVSAAPDVAAKVMAPESGYIWARDGDRLSFVRQAQMEPFAELKPLAMGCGVSPSDAGRFAEQYYAQNVKLRNALRPTPEGSVLALQLVRRVQMPVLCLLLTLLVANALIGPRVAGRRQAVQSEIMALERQLGKADDASRSRTQTLAEWGHIPPHGYAWLCDRAASVIPKDIFLTSLSVQPLLKTIEEGKKPNFSENEMVITGCSARSESVSGYAAALGNLHMARQVRLSSVEHDREKDVYTFRINLEL